MKKFFGHLHTVNKHRFLVFVHCCKAGIFWRGLKHDLTKFLPGEFFESVRFFSNGKQSPLATSKNKYGYSKAWLIHKGRNKHHPEFWFDPDCEVQPVMPYKYAIECVCDKLAATKCYKKKQYKQSDAYKYWSTKTPKDYMSPKTRQFIEQCLKDVAKKGENFVLNKKYLKSTYNKIIEG